MVNPQNKEVEESANQRLLQLPHTTTVRSVGATRKTNESNMNMYNN